MTTYNDQTEDLLGRQIHPVLFNTAKDGSGTFLFPVLDSDGKFSLGAATTAIGKVDHNISAIADGRKTVTTAGTAVALSTTTTAKYVIITAEADNTGVIAVGGSTVVAALATRRGYYLNAGEAVGFPIDNLADVYIDSAVNGDGVTFVYFN